MGQTPITSVYGSEISVAMLSGRYIVDFICIEKKLIIEIDGGQHNEPDQQDYDNHRTAYLHKLGYRILRFWNNEVLEQIDLVMDQIYLSVC